MIPNQKGKHKMKTEERKRAAAILCRLWNTQSAGRQTSKRQPMESIGQCLDRMAIYSISAPEGGEGVQA